MATIYKRTKADGSYTFWTKFRRDGRLIRTNTGTDNRAKAQAFLRQQIGAIEQGVAPEVDVRKVTYEQIRDDLVRHYQTHRTREEKEYTKRIKHLDEFFARHRAAAITESEVTRYVAHRQGQVAHNRTTPPTAATINRELQVLVMMLRLAHRGRKLVHVPHVERLKEAAPRSGFVNQDTFEVIRKNLPADLQLALVFGYTYVMRSGEVLGLEWEKNIDFDAREIRLLAGETKNDDGRVLPMTVEVEVLLREQRTRIVAALGRLTDCVFPLLPGARAHANLIGTRRTTFKCIWKTATAAAGVPGLLVHDLRRSAVRNLIRAGVSEKVAMSVSGHKSAGVFARYNIVSTDNRREAMEKVRRFQLNGGGK